MIGDTRLHTPSVDQLEARASRRAWTLRAAGLTYDAANRLRWAVISLLVSSASIANASDVTLVQVASTTNASVSELSKSVRQGIQAAFDRLNRTHSGSYDHIKLLTIDDDFNQVKAAAAFKQVAGQPDVLGLIGCVGTPAQIALAKDGTLVKSGLASIAPATGADVILEPNFFPVRATYRAEVDRLLKQAASMSQKRVALIWWNAGVGPTLSASFVEQVKAEGLNLVSNVSFDLDRDPGRQRSNIMKAVTLARSANPSAIVFVSAGRQGYDLVKAMRAAFPRSVGLYSISALGWRDVIEHAGIDDAAGVMFSQAVPFPYDGVNSPLVRDYLEDLHKTSPAAEPDYASLEGYLAGRVVGLALKRIKGNVTRESFLAALNSIGRFESGDFSVDYGPNARVGMKRADITIIDAAGRLRR